MRWILRISLTLLTLVILSVAALFLIPTDRIAKIAEAQFFENTGRELILRGEVRPQLFPRLGVALGEVEIANAAWASDAPMVTADRLEVAVGLSALMGGNIAVEAFTIEGPVIRLQRNKDGVGNWDFLGSKDGESAASGAPRSSRGFSLPEGTLTDATIIYQDDKTGARYVLEDMDATLALPDLRGPAEMSLNAILQGQPISASLAIDGVQQILDGAVRPATVEAVLAGNEIALAGSVGLMPLQISGDLDADLARMSGLFALLEMPAPDIPAGFGQHPKLRGQVTLSADNRFFLRDGVIELDQNRLTGDLDLSLADSPIVKARLQAGALDFSGLSSDTTPRDGAANTDAGGWSQNRIDASALGLANGEFTLQAQSIDLGSVQLGATALKGTLDRSRLVFDLGGVEAFAGRIAGQFVINNRGSLSVGGDLSASSVALETLLEDFSGFDRLIGRADMQLKFLGAGGSMAEIMRSLSGSGGLDTGAGELLGLDIAGMLRNLDPAYVGAGSKTVYDDIVANFTMDNGVLRNGDLSFTSKLLTARGRGTLDLGEQTIDYRVEPVALSDRLGTGISVPFTIKGPWSDVRFRPDLDALIDQNLANEKAELKAKAKAEEVRAKRRLDAKLEEKLGVKRGKGQSTEDVLKDALKKEASRSLRKLFGND